MPTGWKRVAIGLVQGNDEMRRPRLAWFRVRTFSLLLKTKVVSTVFLSVKHSPPRLCYKQTHSTEDTTLELARGATKRRGGISQAHVTAPTGYPPPPQGVFMKFQQNPTQDLMDSPTGAWISTNVYNLFGTLEKQNFQSKEIEISF